VKKVFHRLIWPVLTLAAYYAALRLAPAQLAGEATDLAENTCSRLIERASLEAASVSRLEKCATADPYDVELMRSLGSAYEARNEWAVAEDWYRHALVIDPDDGDVHVQLGRLLLRRHDAAGARTEAVAALRVQPGGTAATALAHDAGVLQ
jgi:Tfp pilus assembly protein PilF